MKRLTDRLLRTATGGGLIAAGLLAFAAPLATGTWSLQFLALPLLAVGLFELYTAISSPDRRGRPLSYASGLFAVAGALLLYVSPSLVASGLIAVLLLLLAADGVIKIGHCVLRSDASAPRIVTAINGLSNVALALIGWWVSRQLNVEIAIGLLVGGFTVAVGWRILVSPPPAPEGVRAAVADAHPYAKLGLGRSELFVAANRNAANSTTLVGQTELYWLAVAALVLFTTHVGRMRATDTWLGLISPVVATAGDLVMAVLIGAGLILPLRLLWRRASLSLERKAWQLRLSGEEARMQAFPRALLRKWTDARLAFSRSLLDARASLPVAAGVVLRLGLPVAILFAALNPVWGFNWYFNTESWASAFYQKMTELRVDRWRAAMIDAVTAAHRGENGMFQVRPPGIETGDFSFLVIGDSGEGDASQYALIARYLELGRRDDIKFLIVASDVIYPAGAMEDYEKNFYLPFHGFTKPIYAIPGNHDWFDALEGFNANFLTPQAARAALRARADADHGLTSTTGARIERMIAQAGRLREMYAVKVAAQRGPFFEIQTPDFSLIAIDTGIRRTIDERQSAWLDDALARAHGKFTMAILGHPKYAAGVDTSIEDEDFAALHARLDGAGVDVLMAGDTHAFEYYVDYRDDGQGVRPVFHFVNGGGGAYLSIGGAMGWPERPPTETWAFYPGTDAVRRKLDAETPWWKWPVWAWTRRFGTWPVSTETLSGMFDFNRAPFYQSFVEVRVERSQHRVVFALHGVSGPVRWRDLQASFRGIPGAAPDAAVEFVATMPPSKP